MTSLVTSVLVTLRKEKLLKFSKTRYGKMIFGALKKAYNVGKDGLTRDEIVKFVYENNNFDNSFENVAMHVQLALNRGVKMFALDRNEEAFTIRYCFPSGPQGEYPYTNVGKPRALKNKGSRVL